MRLCKKWAKDLGIQVLDKTIHELKEELLEKELEIDKNLLVKKELKKMPPIRNIENYIIILMIYI